MTLNSTIALVESLKRFRIVSALGKGGMGNVFEAVEPNGSHIAVKIFHPEVVLSIAHGEDIFSDLHKAVVKHPNLCRLLDFYRDEQTIFLTMEYIQGQSLRSIIKGRRHCPVEHGLQLAIEAIRGVSALHAVGLAHGDVRPVNVLVLEGSSVKLIDYGVRYPAALCKPFTASKKRTYTGYMAPEVWLGSEPSLSSDVYDLGVLTYHLLTGYKPRKDPQQRITPLSLCKSVPAEVEKLVLKALSLKPEVRPSAIEMLACLDSTPRFTDKHTLL